MANIKTVLIKPILRVLLPKVRSEFCIFTNTFSQSENSQSQKCSSHNICLILLFAIELKSAEWQHADDLPNDQMLEIDSNFPGNDGSEKDGHFLGETDIHFPAHYTYLTPFKAKVTKLNYRKNFCENLMWNLKNSRTETKNIFVSTIASVEGTWFDEKEPFSEKEPVLSRRSTK